MRFDRELFRPAMESRDGVRWTIGEMRNTSRIAPLINLLCGSLEAY
jgi:hypothetical protein